MTDTTFETSPVMHKIALLNLRINDMMNQLNSVLKTIVDENINLKKEKEELKAKQQKESKS